MEPKTHKGQESSGERAVEDTIRVISMWWQATITTIRYRTSVKDPPPAARRRRRLWTYRIPSSRRVPAAQYTDDDSLHSTSGVAAITDDRRPILFFFFIWKKNPKNKKEEDDKNRQRPNTGTSHGPVECRPSFVSPRQKPMEQHWRGNHRSEMMAAISSEQRDDAWSVADNRRRRCRRQ